MVIDKVLAFFVGFMVIVLFGYICFIANSYRKVAKSMQDQEYDISEDLDGLDLLEDETPKMDGNNEN